MGASEAPKKSYLNNFLSGGSGPENTRNWDWNAEGRMVLKGEIKENGAGRPKTGIKT